MNKKIIGIFVMTLLIATAVLPVTGINDGNGYERTISSIDDTTPPITTKTVGNPKYGPNDEWVTGLTPFTLTATDDISGVDKTYYRTWYNGLWTLWTEYTIGFYLFNEGMHYIEFYSIDNANNIEDKNSQTHYVDNSAPITTCEFGTPYFTDGVDEWITPLTPIYLEGTDPPGFESGMNQIAYRYGGDGWTAVDGDKATFSIPDGCTHLIEYYSVDNLGNTEMPKNQIIKVDNTKADAGGPYLVNPYETVQFDSSGSHISSCSLPVTYLWDFGDGDTSTEQNPTHTYLAEGVTIFTVTLTITTVCFSHIDTTTVIIDSKPYKPSNPIPENHATYVDVDADLSWTGGDPDEGDTVTYDIYFGDVNPPPLEKSGHNDTTYNLSTMNFSTTYYWYIISWDNYGKTNGGILWDFTTVGEDMNQPPNKPATPDGPTTVKSGTEYTYATSTTDPDGDQVHYWFDWGDGNDSGWLGPYDSGEICEASNTWTFDSEDVGTSNTWILQDGGYQIKVKAKDMHGAESEWSDPLGITAPENKAINPFILLLERLIERFPMLEQMLQPIYNMLVYLY